MDSSVLNQVILGGLFVDLLQGPLGIQARMPQVSSRVSRMFQLISWSCKSFPSKLSSDKRAIDYHPAIRQDVPPAGQTPREALPYCRHTQADRADQTGNAPHRIVIVLKFLGLGLLGGVSVIDPQKCGDIPVLPKRDDLMTIVSFFSCCANPPTGGSNTI